MKISDAERNSYHPDVDVFFQVNAWVDTKVAVEWVEKTLNPVVEELNRYVLYCDNLTAQTHDSFKSAVSEKSGVAWFGLPKATDLWQPVDAGYAQLLKVLMCQQFENWLDDDEHAERWYANEKPFTASERRVLITHWGGNAYKKLCSPQYDDLHLQIFVKTGCFMTSDGSDDHLVKPEGLADYVIPPPSLFIQPASAEPQTIGVEQEEMPADVEEAEPIEPEETDDNLIDKEKDIILNDDFNLVGRKVRALYGNGWFIGDIVYFNTVLREYKVEFDDGTSDYIEPSDIDNVEVMILDV